MWRSALTCILLVVFADRVLAQSGDRLPSKLSGRWTFTGPRQTFINSVTIEIDGNGKLGPVTGRMTWRGVTCGAQDEPLTGTWDGSELRFASTLRANVNADRMNGQCGDGKTTFLLKRKAGQAGFEGEAHADYTPAVPTISVSP